MFIKGKEGPNELATVLQGHSHSVVEVLLDFGTSAGRHGGGNRKMCGTSDGGAKMVERRPAVKM